MVNQKEALAAMQDIHLPPPTSGWPWAPGWYLVLLLGLVATLSTFILLRRYYLNSRAKRAALRLLSQYQAEHQRNADSQRTTTQISELLRRVALAYYPRTRVAGLMGSAWIDFLSSTASGVPFNTVSHQLLETPYQMPHDANLEPLFDVARQWIKKQGRPCLN